MASVEDLFQKGSNTAGELLGLMQNSVEERGHFASSLNSIAGDLENVKGKVNIVKVIGTSVSLLGTIGGIAATTLTGIHSEFSKNKFAITNSHNPFPYNDF